MKSQQTPNFPSVILSVVEPSVITRTLKFLVPPSGCPACAAMKSRRMFPTSASTPQKSCNASVSLRTRLKHCVAKACSESKSQSDLGEALQLRPIVTDAEQGFNSAHLDHALNTQIGHRTDNLLCLRTFIGQRDHDRYFELAEVAANLGALLLESG